MVCGSCIAAAAVAGAGTMGFFRVVDMLRDGGLRKTWAFLRGDASSGDPPEQDDDRSENEEHETLTGSRS